MIATKQNEPQTEPLDDRRSTVLKENGPQCIQHKRGKNYSNYTNPEGERARLGEDAKAKAFISFVFQGTSHEWWDPFARHSKQIHKALRYNKGAPPWINKKVLLNSLAESGVKAVSLKVGGAELPSDRRMVSYALNQTEIFKLGKPFEKYRISALYVDDRMSPINKKVAHEHCKIKEYDQLVVCSVTSKSKQNHTLEGVLDAFHDKLYKKIDSDPHAQHDGWKYPATFKYQSHLLSPRFSLYCPLFSYASPFNRRRGAIIQCQ